MSLCWGDNVQRRVNYEALREEGRNFNFLWPRVRRRRRGHAGLNYSTDLYWGEFAR